MAALAPPASGSDADLLDRYHRGRDEAAFAGLVRRHAPAVRAMARARLANSADADDVTQATFLVLARDAGRVRESVAGWLVRVAHLTALQHRRNLARRRTEPLPDHLSVSADPGDAAATREVAAVVAEELAALPDKLRAVVALCALDGLTAAVAAERLGVPKGTVDSRLATAKRRLADRLARRGLAAGSVAALAVGPAPAEFCDAVSASAFGYAFRCGVATPVSLLADGVRPAMTSTARLFALGLVAATVTGTAGTALYHDGPGDNPKAGPPVKSPAPPPTATLTLNPPTTDTPAGRPPVRTEADVRARLAEPSGIPDATTHTLGSLLKTLNGPERGLIVRLDMPAMQRYGGVFEDARANLYDIKLNGRLDPRLPLSDLLDEVLCQLHFTTFPLTYRVRGNQVLIGPATLHRGSVLSNDPGLVEGWLAEQALGAPVRVTFDAKPLAAVVAELRTLSGANIVLDPKASEPLKTPITASYDGVRLLTVLRLTAHMAGLEVVATGNVYYLTDPDTSYPLQRQADTEGRDVKPPMPKG